MSGKSLTTCRSCCNLNQRWYMGWKFRKSRRSIKVLPGIRLNTGKNGINSVSLGRRGKLFGATTNINLKTGKTKSTYSVRGIGSFEHKPSRAQPSSSSPSQPSVQPKPSSGYYSYLTKSVPNAWYQKNWVICTANLFFPPVGILAIWLSDWSVFWKCFGTGASLVWLLLLIPA